MQYFTLTHKVLIIIILVITMSLNLFASTLKQDWNNLSHKQKSTIAHSYFVGKRYNLELTMAAIAWQESAGGRYQIGNNDYGIYQINIKYYLEHFGIKDSYHNRSKYATLLIVNPETSEAYVIDKLIYLRNRHNGSYLKVWKHYNGSNDKATAYSYRIRDKVRFLRTIFHKKGKAKWK